MNWKIFGFIAFAALVLGFYVWQQTQSVRLGYRVEEMKRECEKWDQDNANLNLKMRKLMSLERLDQFAKDKKLSVPNDNNRVYLK